MIAIASTTDSDTIYLRLATRKTMRAKLNTQENDVITVNIAPVTRTEIPGTSSPCELGSPPGGSFSIRGVV